MKSDPYFTELYMSQDKKTCILRTGVYNKAVIKKQIITKVMSKTKNGVLAQAG